MSKQVWTPNGLQQGPANSLVGKGETIWNPSTGLSTLVTEGTRGVDNQESSVSPDDDNVILGNDVDWRNGRKFSDNVMPHSAFLSTVNKNRKKIMSAADKSSLSKQTLATYDKASKNLVERSLNALADAANQQLYQHQILDYTNMMKFNKGKERYDNGKLLSSSELMFGHLLPFTASLGLMAYWGSQPITYHSTYASNPYETRALNEMSKIRLNPYPAITAANQSERESAYSNSQAGGLTAAQRNANRIAMAIGNARNRANIFTAANQQNNTYRSQYAQAMMNAGQADRQARMSAYQHDWDDYERAHAARTKGFETGLANLVGASNNMFADIFKVRMADKTLDLYQQNLTNDLTKVANDLKIANANLDVQRQLANEQYYKHFMFSPLTAYTSMPLYTPMSFMDWRKNGNKFS